RSARTRNWSFRGSARIRNSNFRRSARSRRLRCPIRTLHRPQMHRHPLRVRPPRRGRQNRSRPRRRSSGKRNLRALHRTLRKEMSMTATERPDGGVYYATFAVEIAETSEDTEKSLGKVKAIVSTYDNAYQMGVAEWHRFKEGAFAAADGTTVPLFWQHNHSGLAPQPPIGVGKLAATSRGLELDAQFFIDNPAGRAVFSAIKADAVREWSIGYIAGEFEVEEDDGKVTLNISKSSVLEASSALKGANPQTRTLAAASAEVAQKEAALAARLDAIESVQDNQTDDIASLLPLKDTVAELATRLKAVEDLLRAS